MRLVEIPKDNGGKRLFGIPTVADRVAQTVVKMALEPWVEPVFQADSYGYRPGKSALDAVGMARKRCWEFDWVVDLDIKAFFDSLDHDLVERAVAHHTDVPWVRLYISRWLRAPVQRPDGSLEPRTKGTPQGGVISPLLANLFLHYAFDVWMRRTFPECPFERYADDAVVHCQSQVEAQAVVEAIRGRFEQCHLELHPTKTRIVYCKDDDRPGKHERRKFDFLGYTFRPRRAKSRRGKLFMSFLPAISNKAANSDPPGGSATGVWRPSGTINSSRTSRGSSIRSYAARFTTTGGSTALAASKVLCHLDRGPGRVGATEIQAVSSPETSHPVARRCARREPTLSVHWQLGVRPAAGM